MLYEVILNKPRSGESTPYCTVEAERPAEAIAVARRLRPEIRQRGFSVHPSTKLCTEHAEIRRQALREAAEVARNPYSDAVEAFGGDEPFAVGAKIAAAILRLLEPKGGVGT